MMTSRTKTILMISAFTAISACGGGGSDNEASAGIDGPEDLFFASTNPAASASGLAYADPTSTIDDLDGQTAQVRMVRFINDNRTGKTRFETTNETADFIEADNGDLTLTFGGETIVFVDNEGNRANGIPIEIFPEAGDDTVIEGNFSTVFTVFSYVDNQDGFDFGENTEGVFAIGFETNPDVVQALSGQVSYSGDIGGFGLIFDQDGNVSDVEAGFDGEAVFTADFASNTISSDISIALTDGGFQDTDLTLASTAITGNGFAGDLTCADPSICGSDSQIAGAFYGDNAQELTGVTGLSIVDADGNQFIATGGFVAAPSGP